MGAILPLHPLLIRELEVRLVNQGCRIQRLTGAVSSEPVMCGPTQIIVDVGVEVVEGGAATSADLLEELNRIRLAGHERVGPGERGGQQARRDSMFNLRPGGASSSHDERIREQQSGSGGLRCA